MKSRRSGIVLTRKSKSYMRRVAVTRSCLTAGQGAGAINEVLPVAEIVRRVVTEAEQALASGFANA